jgi:membrane protease YdiL (CAAX protease family)
MLLALLYFLLITAAEVLTISVRPQWGVLLHSCLLIALTIQGATATKVKKRRFLLVMALVPLIRILSTALPLAGRPLLDWHVSIGGLLFVAIYFTTRAVQLDARRIGLHLKNWPLQVGLGILGIPLGYFEYLILRPMPLINSWNLVSFLDASFVLIVFTGILEEVIFRGLMQEVTIEMMGFLGIFFSAAVFTVLHVGYKSTSDLFFVFGVALIFGLVVARSHSILGVSLAHGLINIFLYLIFPLAALGVISIPGFSNRPTDGSAQPVPISAQPTEEGSSTMRLTPSPIAITPGSAATPIVSTPQPPDPISTPTSMELSGTAIVTRSVIFSAFTFDSGNGSTSSIEASDGICYTPPSRCG